MPPAVVFDTNILLSSVGWGGNPLQCVELARAGTVQGFTCPELMDEFREKLRMNGYRGITIMTAADFLAVGTRR